jgi:16S rRNA (guanine527-N7)-methyltransferase
MSARDGELGQQVLASNARALGVDLSSVTLASFAIYQRELLDWNDRVNLTAITDPDDVQVRYFADSLAALPCLPPGSLRLLDVGTGAGCPGVAIKLARPEVHLTLLDSVGKKTAFLDHLVAVLGLDGVRVITARAEDLGRRAEEREQHDVVTCRAVASLAALAELCLPLAKVGGLVLAYKKAHIADEIRAAGRAITLLGGRLRPAFRYVLPDSPEERWLIAIEKTRPTPDGYPRRPGAPAKSPL